MEKKVHSIVFRRLTYADFSHINHEGSYYEKGGGQAYIDFPINSINLAKWHEFLGSPTGRAAKGRPVWEFTINSLGLVNPISLKIYQRREQSVSIASQKTKELSIKGNRVPAWDPTNSFPMSYNPNIDNLVVYILKTTDGEYWAGWLLKKDPPSHWNMNYELQELFTESAGYIVLSSKVLIDETNKDWPFYFEAKSVRYKVKTNDDVIEDLADEDTSPILYEVTASSGTDPKVERILKIRKRNNKIVKNLKKLYRGRCQLTGEEYTFKKTDGEMYSELHHLIPLGEDGSDSYANAIVVSPLIHRMLHYADVSDIDLSQIQDNKLPITINGKTYTITWHTNHIRIVEESITS